MTKHNDIETKMHDDGAVSHKVTLPDGSTELVFIKAAHPLTQQFVARGSSDKIRAALNSATDKVSPAEKLVALQKSWDEGRWTMQEGTGKPKGTLLERALMELGEKTLEEVQAILSLKSRAEREALRKQPAVARKMIEMEEEERGKAAAELLDEFMPKAEPTDEERKAA